jgi:hypothetical protein
MDNLAKIGDRGFFGRHTDFISFDAGQPRYQTSRASAFDTAARVSGIADFWTHESVVLQLIPLHDPLSQLSDQTFHNTRLTHPLSLTFSQLPGKRHLKAGKEYAGLGRNILVLQSHPYLFNITLITRFGEDDCPRIRETK